MNDPGNKTKEGGKEKEEEMALQLSSLRFPWRLAFFSHSKAKGLQRSQLHLLNLVYICIQIRGHSEKNYDKILHPPVLT